MFGAARIRPPVLAADHRGVHPVGFDMTESRETLRRRQFRDRSTPVEHAELSLAEICIVDGCLNRRAGTNLCCSCDAASDQ